MNDKLILDVANLNADAICFAYGQRLAILYDLKLDLFAALSITTITTP